MSCFSLLCKIKDCEMILHQKPCVTTLLPKIQRSYRRQVERLLPRATERVAPCVYSIRSDFASPKKAGIPSSAQSSSPLVFARFEYVTLCQHFVPFFLAPCLSTSFLEFKQGKMGVALILHSEPQELIGQEVQKARTVDLCLNPKDPTNDWKC